MLVVGFLLLVAVVVLAASALLTWRLARTIEKENPPVGRLIEAGTARLHLVDLTPEHPPAGASGARDRPAVLLLHGANVQHTDMRVALGDRLARRLRVLLPDRPGQGWSRGRAAPRSPIPAIRWR
ncbi:hypothetical protein [Rhodoplanes azumiensis]|uniref:Alpha/beta hydrolase family protein n=1 Tax=Rhodoplanes azumiensis TaxID=1897628 RepID=A0ABW5AM95_9BRAD